jgi:hypothetical protein
VYPPEQQKSASGAWQGDQTNLWKNRPKCSPTILLLKLVHRLNQGKSSHKWGILLYLKNCLK